MIKSFLILLLVSVIELLIIIFLVWLLLKKRKESYLEFNKRKIDILKYQKKLKDKGAAVDEKIKKANNIDDIVNIFDELQDYDNSH
jgi:hypothetical protein